MRFPLIINFFFGKLDISNIVMGTLTKEEEGTGYAFLLLGTIFCIT